MIEYKEIHIIKGRGGFVLKPMLPGHDKNDSTEVLTSLEGVFTKILELFEDRTKDGTGDKYGKVTIIRDKDLEEIVKKARAAEGEIEARTLIDPQKKVVHEDRIVFEEKGAVETIKNKMKPQGGRDDGN